MSAFDRLQFPYMFWAHTESFRSPYSLSQSGMPPAPAALFADLGIDLGFPGVEALPQFEQRLGELYGVDPARVIVTPGATGGMHLAALRWFRPGARVLVDVPSYEPFRALPQLMGAERLLVARRAENGWRIDPDEAAARLAGGSGTAHVFTSNPHNPTGARSDAREMRALAELAERGGGLLVCCEVYMDYLPNEARVHAFDLAPNGVTIGSLTKAFGLGALRLGWMILGESVAAQRTQLTDLCYLSFIDPPTATLRAGQRALDRLSDLLKPVRLVERECRPHWARWLQETSGVDCVVPEHGIIAFPRIEGVDDTVELCRFLQEQHGVDTVPGEFFGLFGHLRVGCGVPEQTLVEGLRRLEAGIAAWHAAAR